MPRLKRRRVRDRRRPLIAESLETRCLLAASVGWDGPGLGSANLTYTISNAPSSLPQAEVDAAIQTAFKAWSDVADITFTEVNQTGLRDSIDISFDRLDGSGGTLAQAYFPDDVNPARIAGDIQFDLSESWEVGNSQGNRAFDLTWVAVHEIGHALGLNHSNDAGSVLRASVSPGQQFTSLASDDVDNIRRLYASADNGTNTPTETTPAETVDDPVADTPTTNEGGTTNNNDRFNRWWNWFRRGNWWRWFGRAEGGQPGAESPTFFALPPSIAQAGSDTGGADDDADQLSELNLPILKTSGTNIGFAIGTFQPVAQTADHSSELVNRISDRTESDSLRTELDRVFAEFGRHL